MRRCASSILLFVSLANSAHMFAQGDPCLHRVLPVNVVDDKGLIIRDLTASDFKASFHGKPVKIVSVKPNRAAPRVMIVLDASGSMMESNTNWAYNLKTARSLLQGMPPSTLMGLAVFSTKVETHIPPTQDPSKVIAELDRLGLGKRAFPKDIRKTALWDALNVVASDFDPPQTGDSIYALTDADDNSSVIHFGALKQTLLDRGIRVFASNLRMEQDGPTPEDTLGRMSMQDLVDSTGGSAVTAEYDAMAPSSGKIPTGPRQAAELVVGQMRQVLVYYEVEVELPGRWDKAKDWKLETAHLKERYVRVVYPRTLAPCPAHPSVAATTP
jgi:hypothetical protein